MSKKEALYNYYLNQDEPIQGCLLAMEKIILNQDKGISETLKWGLPCFSYKAKIFCFLHVDKKTKEPYILFEAGQQINDERLEQGNRKKMKIFKVDAHADIPIKTIEELIHTAINLYKK